MPVVAGLWPHQVDAVDAVTRAVGRGGRTTLVAACGTGKTRIGGAVAADLGSSRRVLIVLPTIELLTQTLQAYRAAADSPLGTVVAVCSDPTVAELEMLAGEPDVLVTTAASALAEATAIRGPVTVLSTYASLPVISAAHAHHHLARWDLVVVDEAHRTTGTSNGSWKLVHRDELVPAHRRLYMTATPRVAERRDDQVVSMNDTTIYGEVSYRLPFSRAIDLGLLADYRVVVPVVTDEEVHRLATDEHLAMRLGGSSLPPSALAGQIAVIRTMTEYGVRRAISYHHRIAEAKTWAHTLPAAASLMPGSIDLWAGHVSGKQAPHLRRRIIDRLADPGPETVVVANAKVLNEGVDVPAVDAVVFARPRESAIDTIQAVGRALRTGGRADKIATIVVPLLLAAGESPEAALEGSEWEPVWKVIRALRDHDDRMDEYLRVRRTRLGEGTLFEAGSREVKLPPWLDVRGVEIPDEFAQAILIRAVRASTPSWDEYYGAARAYFRLHGHSNIPGDWISPGGLKVGQWISTQRKTRKAGRLSAERATALEAINIVWDTLDELWTKALSHAQAFHRRHGHLNIRQDYRAEGGYHLGVWIGWQRTAFRTKTLPAERVAALEEIGMIWDLALTAWQNGYTHAHAYFTEHGDLRVHNEWVAEDGYNLGLWVGAQRGNFQKGKLSDEQITLLDAIGMVWDVKDTAWRTAYEHACAYRERNGHLDVPGVWSTPDGFNLGNWIGKQRKSYRDGKLPADKIRDLEELGIVWNVRDAQWNQGYAAAREYAKRNKDLRVHAKYVTESGYKLGGWIAEQRKLRLADALPQDRISLLDEIGMSWNPTDETWQAAYAELRQYREENGNLDVPQDFLSRDGINLFKWIGTQRLARGKGKMSKERVALLDEIGFPWDPERERWTRRYTEVKAALGGRTSRLSLLPGSPDRIWLDNQAIAYRQGKLDAERTTLLEALGIGSDEQWALWLNTYEELVAFVKEEGHFRVPEDYHTVDDIALAKWVSTQRSRWRRGRLPDRECRMLDKIEFPWETSRQAVPQGTN